MDKNLLLAAGFSPGEVSVYLALLELGESTTGPLAIAARVSQSKTYNILERLAQKGLVSTIRRKNIQYYSAGDPKKILTYLKERQDELQRVSSDIKASLPELLARFGTQAFTQVQVYKGLAGLMAAHAHTYDKLKRGGEYLYLGIPASNPQIHHISFQRDHLRRIEAGIKCRLLFNNDTAQSVIDNRNGYTGCVARRMPAGVQTPSYFLIYADTVMIAVPHERDTIAIEIVNRKVADSFRTYFEQYWKISR